MEFYSTLQHHRIDKQKLQFGRQRPTLSQRGVAITSLLRKPKMTEDEPIEIPITSVFDLHTIAARDVKAATEAYLDEAHRRGLTAVRIIHGRGIGVQREMVRSILRRTPYVLDYSDAPADAGGWGATIITLAPVATKT
jgi:dsDNA-specific endonuclease/ATPase MutS2